MGLYTAIGNLGSIGGTWIFPANEAPLFREGYFICMGLAFATAIISLSNSLVLGAINRHRDKKHGEPVPGASIDVTELADESPHFRFFT
jgi:hypothetical protein